MESGILREGKLRLCEAFPDPAHAVLRPVIGHVFGEAETVATALIAMQLEWNVVFAQRTSECQRVFDGHASVFHGMPYKTGGVVFGDVAFNRQFMLHGFGNGILSAESYYRAFVCGIAAGKDDRVGEHSKIRVQGGV